MVERPATWREAPYTLSYLLTPCDVKASDLVQLLCWAHAGSMPNPHVITPTLLRWSSLLHPRFYASVRGDFPVAVPPLVWVDDELPDDFQSLSRLWFQSVLFLSGVTLSAAIIQGRYSAGTISSKFDRLWDAGTLAELGLAPELRPLELHARIKDLAAQSDTVPMLLELRALFMQALCLIAPASGTIETLRRTEQLPPDGRFGFVGLLRETLGNTLRAVVVYGSSVSSTHFADIDALVVTDDPVSALRKLSNTSPMWQSKELNLGVYSPEELLVMQRLSGDNLSDYGVCVYGETQVVRKPVSPLLARNFSFGIVRQRQQLGMLSREIGVSVPIDVNRLNLNEYFVKIPANVAKGTFGAAGQRLPKEQVHDWLITSVGFDTPRAQAQVARGDVIDALANSVLATGQALHALNRHLNVIHDSDALSTETRSLSS